MQTRGDLPWDAPWQMGGTQEPDVATAKISFFLYFLASGAAGCFALTASDTRYAPAQPGRSAILSDCVYLSCLALLPY